MMYPSHPFVLIPPAALALAPAANVTSFSYGFDHSMRPDDPVNGKMRVHYSATRGSVGSPGSVVAAQAAGNGAAGDMFQMTTLGFPPAALGAPSVVVNAPTIGLTPTGGIPPQSDIDGMDIYRSAVVGTVFDYRRVYFCVDAGTAASLGVTTATVLYKAAPGAAPPTVYATPAQLGLVAGDVIDALAVFDADNIGVLGGLFPDDAVYVSLAPGSPSAAALGTATLIEVYPTAAPAVRIAPAALGLLATDDLDAVAIFDPCPADTHPLPTGDGVVNIDDLLVVINQWGGPGYNVADSNGDEFVNIDDLVEVICEWRPAPHP